MELYFYSPIRRHVVEKEKPFIFYFNITEFRFSCLFYEYSGILECDAVHIGCYRRFGGVCCLHLCRVVLKPEGAGSQKIDNEHPEE